MAPVCKLVPVPVAVGEGIAEAGLLGSLAEEERNNAVKLADLPTVEMEM